MNPGPLDEKMEEHLKRRRLLKMQVGITKGETFPLVVAVRKLELEFEKLKIQTETDASGHPKGETRLLVSV